MRGSSIAGTRYRAAMTFLLIVLIHVPRSGNGQEVVRNVKIHEGVVQTRPRTDAHVLGRRYVWNYQQRSYTIVLEVAVERYNAYNARDRVDIAGLVLEGAETLGPIAREFQSHIQQNPGWSPAERAGFVLTFVQALPYTSDSVTTGYDEFRRFGIETLVTVAETVRTRPSLRGRSCPSWARTLRLCCRRAISRWVWQVTFPAWLRSTRASYITTAKPRAAGGMSGISHRMSEE